jgi:transcriptional regulator with XRE-family HTH domain
VRKPERTHDAVEILHNRYVKDDAERKASVEVERVNVEVARMIYDLRTEAGLTQAELADLVGTTQSVISRLEDSDYDGHSLSMLTRIAEALKQKVVVLMTAKDPKVGTVRYAFHLFLQLLRRQRRLTMDDLAKQTDIDRSELVAIERNAGYRPSPLTLHRLSKFYEIPEGKMLALAGAVKEIPTGLSERASRFAARSEAFARLSKEERNALDEFLSFLKTDV